MRTIFLLIMQIFFFQINLKGLEFTLSNTIINDTIPNVHNNSDKHEIRFWNFGKSFSIQSNHLLNESNLSNTYINKENKRPLKGDQNTVILQNYLAIILPAAIGGGALLIALIVVLSCCCCTGCPCYRSCNCCVESPVMPLFNSNSFNRSDLNNSKITPVQILASPPKKSSILSNSYSISSQPSLI